MSDGPGRPAQLLAKLSDPDVQDGLAALLDAVGDMRRTGALATLVETAHLIHAMRSAASDSMVERAFAFIEHMANSVGTEDLATLAHEAKGAMEDAADSCRTPGDGGLLGTLRLLARPETHEALRFVLSFSDSLRRRFAAMARAPQG